MMRDGHVVGRCDRAGRKFSFSRIIFAFVGEISIGLG